MIQIVFDILILLFATLTYREIKLKKITAKQNVKGFVAMRLYREHVKRERERGLKTHD